MTKRLCPDTDQNCVQTVPKYAVAPEAEAIRSHYVHQNFYFSFYYKIVDRNQRKVLSDLRKQNFSSNLVKFWTVPRHNFFVIFERSI